ncbi:MAG TPA: LeuA family protein, partial [Desulfatiglandales bacterium]|nr:LeuA family protein [Desulfatiglandales bacterium]
MTDSRKKVIIKDSTLREGLDTPTVSFTMKQRLKIAFLLNKAKVQEIELAAPGNFLKDLEFARALKDQRLKIRTSGLIYAHSPLLREEIREGGNCLDRFDILMPVSLKRRPYDKKSKIKLLLDALDYSLSHHADVGVGFPHSTQVDARFLAEIGKKAVKNGAKRITVYDTSGRSDPFEIHALIKRLKKGLDVPLFFHGHNDLGLATANSISAVYAGADGLDLTVNGLGDRAGNASLEQVALGLHLKGLNTGIILKNLKLMSETLAEMSNIPLSKLAPVVGDFVFFHKSP